MRLISQSDAEIVQIANLVIRSTARNTVHRSLREAWESTPNNPEKAFAYAAYSLAYVQVETISSERHKHLTHAVEALTDCLVSYDDWWLARFLRCETMQELPPSTENHLHRQVVSAEEDRLELLSRQEKLLKTEPYFLCPYISEAKASVCQGKIDDAINTVDVGLEKVKLFSVQYRLNVLIQPFISAILLFREVGLETIAERIKLAGLSLFPRSATLASI